MWRRLGWYARRLAVMERGEIRHRIREHVARRAVRRERGGWSRFAVPAARPTVLPLFAPLFETELPAPVARQLEIAADTFRSGRLRLLNRDWPRSILDGCGCVDPAIWTLDPVSGTSWPGAERSAFDIDFRFAGGHREVKYVAEANRLHFLVAPAIYARRTRDAGLAEAVLGSIRSWMEANPPGRGVNWYSGIEAGYRLVSIGGIVSALDPWIDTAAGESLVSFVAAHGDWLARFPSLHSSANNHLVAEAMGLVLAARMLPEHKQASAWLSNGRAHLKDRALALFYEDGVGQEQSPAYAAFTLEMLLIGLGAVGEAFDDAVRERLATAAGALNAFLDGNGNPPLIGDDDQSRILLAHGSDEPRYAASICAAVAGYLDRPDLAPAVRDPHWRDIVFAAPPPGAPPADGTTTFPHGGYTVRCGAIAGRRVHFVFDHGPLGFGALAAHGHADALSVWLSLDGRPVLVDAGTHLYHSEGENRRRFRVSGVHNTLTIDGVSQSEPSGPFNWMPRRARAALDRSSNGRALDVSASHDGYAKRFGVVHHRDITETTDGFDITDRLVGTQPPGDVEIAFLLAPELDVRTVGNTCVAVYRDGRPEITLMAPEGAGIKIVRADAASGRGFHSPGFGILTEAATVVFRAPASRMLWRSSILINPLT